MFSKRMLAGTLLMLVVASATGAQPPVTGIYARDGWEAFAGVSYEGGDATQPKPLMGMLVLTESTIALHPCTFEQCQDDKKGGRPFREPPYFSISLRSVKQITSSSPRARGAGAAVGGLIPARPEDFVAIIYETKSSLEAPLFKIAKTQVMPIDQKLRIRLAQLGVQLQVK